MRHPSVGKRHTPCSCFHPPNGSRQFNLGSNSMTFSGWSAGACPMPTITSSANRTVVTGLVSASVTLRAFMIGPCWKNGFERMLTRRQPVGNNFPAKPTHVGNPSPLPPVTPGFPPGHHPRIFMKIDVASASGFHTARSGPMFPDRYASQAPHHETLRHADPGKLARAEREARMV